MTKQKSQDDNNAMKTIFECAKIICHLIINPQSSAPWVFDKTLTKLPDVPHELKTLLRRITVGPVTKLSTENREKAVDQSSSIIAQNIMYATKSQKQVSHTSSKGDFRHRNENPQVLVLGLAVHHKY